MHFCCGFVDLNIKAVPLNIEDEFLKVDDTIFMYYTYLKPSIPTKD